MTDQATELAQGIGAQIKALRVKWGKTQEEVAHLARGVGIPWDRTTEAKVERGERGVSLAELLLLALAFGEPLAALIPDNATLVLTDDATIEGASLRRLLDGEVLGPDSDGVRVPLTRSVTPEDMRAVTSSAMDGLRDEKKLVAPFVPDMDGYPLMEASLEAVRVPEQTLANDLGVAPIVVAAIAHTLFNHGLVEERDRRLSERLEPDASPARRRTMRGRVTRELKEEIHAEIETRR